MKLFSILSDSFSINGQCELWNSVGVVPKCCYFRIRQNPLARTSQPLLCLNIILEVLYLSLWLMGLDIALSRCAPERPCYPLRERNHYHSLRRGIGAHSQGCYGDEKTVTLFVFYSLTNASPRWIKRGDYPKCSQFFDLIFWAFLNLAFSRVIKFSHMDISFLCHLIYKIVKTIASQNSCNDKNVFVNGRVVIFKIRINIKWQLQWGHYVPIW